MKRSILICFVFVLGINLIHSQNAYPLVQTPAVGNKEFTVLIASFEGKPVPNSTISRVNAAVNTFNEYTNTVSGGKIRISPIISPVMSISHTPPNMSDKLVLMRQTAQQNGININVPYLGYVIISNDLIRFGGRGSGNGTTGQIIMGGSNLWIPGIVHEMMHMFSVGHANIREGGNKIFPGVVQGGRDPYYFMGSEGDQKNCPYNTNTCNIFATLSLPHKGRFAWIDHNEYEVSDNNGSEKTFKIFNHNNSTRSTKEKLGVYLKGYDDNGVFVVSYLKVKDLNQHKRLTSDGLMIHYVPYKSPAISELLDLTPNSITSNTERPNDITYTHMHDAGDSAIGVGQSMDVSDLFNIKVIRENIESGENNHSVEFKITPLTCPIINSPFDREDFVYTEVGSENKCLENFSKLWNLNPDSRNIARIDHQSLEYASLVSSMGGSLKIPLDNRSAPRTPAFLMRRTLKKTYTNGESMWLGYLLKVNQIKNGHIFVSPNSDLNIGIGKRWGNLLGINNTSVNSRSLTNGETVFLVAKYELNHGSANDNVYLWVNPNTNEPLEQNAITYKKNINIGEIKEIGINFKSVGDFNIDRIAIANSYSNLITNGAPIGQYISLQKSRGDRLFVAAENGNNRLIADRSAVRPWEKFLVETHPDGGIALKANANNLYIRVPGFDTNAAVQPRGQRKGKQEQFEWKSMGQGKVAIRSVYTGRWLQAPWIEDKTIIRARGVKSLGWETFNWKKEVLEASNLSLKVNSNMENTWFKLYPNPVSDIINIKLTEQLLTKETTLTLIDGLGRTIRTIAVKQEHESIDVSDLTSGLYFIKIIGNDKVMHKTFIKR